MAKTQATAAAAETAAPAPPEGFIQVQRAERLYWVHEYEGRPNPLQGYPVLRSERHDSTPEKPGYFYVWKCTAPTMAVDRDKVIHQVQKGDMIIVDERVQLQPIAQYLSMPKLIELYVISKGKVKGGQGNVVLFDIHAKPTAHDRPALPTGAEKLLKALPPAEDTTGKDDDGDIPF